MAGPCHGPVHRWEQHKLAQQLSTSSRPGRSGARESLVRRSPRVEQAAARFRRTATVGQAIGRIVIPRLGVNMVFVNGTDEGSLRKGPGRDLRTFMPGQSRLVYIAGHRTTFLAPFAQITRYSPVTASPGDALRHVHVPGVSPHDRARRRSRGAEVAAARSPRSPSVPSAFLCLPPLHGLRTSRGRRTEAGAAATAGASRSSLATERPCLRPR